MNCASLFQDYLPFDRVKYSNQVPILTATSKK